MKLVTLYTIAEVEDVSNILEHFEVESLEEVSKIDLLDYLTSEFGEPELDECDSDEFDLIDDDTFLDHRVDEDDSESGHIIQIVNDDQEVIRWGYFKIVESEY